MKNILVVDAQFRSALAVIRSLGKRNIRITAGSEIKSAMGLYSKYCHKRVVYPNPRTHTQLFLEHLLKFVNNNNYECIIPSHTYTAFLLAKYKNIFSEHTRVPPPDFKVFINAFDKKTLLKIAMKNNIQCPQTYFYDELDEIVAAVHQYPVVVKPSKRHGVGIAICNSVSELKEKYIEMSNKFGTCIVQDFIPNGGEFGVYTMFSNDSKPIALTVQKRLQTYNSYGGVSTLRETVKNENLVQIAFDLLKVLNWSGVAMVEFRIDTRDGLPKLMEINPRFWGSLPLSICSGVDFPYLLYKLIMDEDQFPIIDYNEGVQCRWLVGNLLKVFQDVNNLKCLQDLFRPNVHFDIVSIGDPAPMILSILPPWDSCDVEPRDDSEKTRNDFILTK